MCDFYAWQCICSDQEGIVVLPAWQTLGSGLLAGTVAAFLTNPVDMAVCRIFAYGGGADKPYKGLFDALRGIVKESGYRGELGGYKPNRIVTTLTLVHRTLSLNHTYNVLFK